jgi:hypothetical protein
MGVVVTLWACALLLPKNPAHTPITSLQPDHIVIEAAPFPFSDLFRVAELYSNASDALYLPSRAYSNSNVVLGLDFPGLAQVDVASWLPKTRLGTRAGQSNKSQSKKSPIRLPAEKASLVVDIANVTIALNMVQEVWPALIHATTDLLVIGLGRDHPEYRGLRNSLLAVLALRQPQIASDYPLPLLENLWDDLRAYAASHPPEADKWLRRLLEALEKDVAGNRSEAECIQHSRNQGEAPWLTLGSSAPTLEQLVEHDRGRRQTIPQLLSGLTLSPEACLQSLRVAARMARAARPPRYWTHRGVGMDRHNDFCMPRARRLLDDVAENRCRPPTTYLGGLRTRYFINRSPTSNKQVIEAVSTALCAAEDFLSAVAAPATRVRDRVLSAAEERGGTAVTCTQRIANYFKTPQETIWQRIARANTALDVVQQLRALIGIQRRLLANMAILMRRACVLQDGLRDHILSLRNNQSSWWRLEVDAKRGTTVLAFTTFPSSEETIAQFRAALARLKSQDEPLKRTRALEAVARELQEQLLSGWLERMDLGGLPREGPRELGDR